MKMTTPNPRLPHTRKSRLSAPQHLAELFWRSDRSRMWRLRNTLRSNGAWQQATRIEDLCHTHISHKWLVRAVSLHRTTLSPTCRRDWATGAAQVREVVIFVEGASLDPQLEHGETCSPAEATRGHYACVSQDAARLWDVCGILHCSGSPRRCSTSCL